MDDRISELPRPILHRILSRLQYGDNHKDAVRTSVLSKSWRHLWSTNHDFVINETDFVKDGAQQFMHVLQKTLQGYTDQNLSIQEFDVRISTFVSASLLQQWIPIVINDMRATEFDLHYQSIDSDSDPDPDSGYEYFDIPSVVFESEHIRVMYLVGCNLGRVDSMDTLHLNNLNTLSLDKVRISNDAFEKIISSCPLVDYLELHRCEELTNIRLVNKARNLKFFGYSLADERHGNTSIEIDVPTIEEISIANCVNWSHPQNHFQPNCLNSSHPQNHFQFLKTVRLSYVRLSTEWFDSFSSNFPSIEELYLWSCYGFKRIKLSSASIKKLTISSMQKTINVTEIHAPNIVDFAYHGSVPRFFSFSTTSVEWSSHIGFTIENNRDWLLKLKEVLKVLRPSKMTFVPRSKYLWDIGGCRFYKPVILERLLLASGPSSSSMTLGFINSLFSISRPKEIQGCKYFENEEDDAWRREHNQLTEVLCKALLIEGELQEMSDWKRDLEEAILESSYYNKADWDWDVKEEEWCRIDAPSWLEPRAALLQNNYVNNHHIRFRLKWREN